MNRACRIVASAVMGFCATVAVGAAFEGWIGESVFYVGVFALVMVIRKELVP